MQLLTEGRLVSDSCEAFEAIAPPCWAEFAVNAEFKNLRQRALIVEIAPPSLEAVSFRKMQLKMFGDDLEL